jgi:hypothetical protein
VVEHVCVSLSYDNFANPEVGNPEVGGLIAKFPVNICSQILRARSDWSPSRPIFKVIIPQLASTYSLNVPVLFCFVVPDGFCGYSLLV